MAPETIGRRFEVWFFFSSGWSSWGKYLIIKFVQLDFSLSVESIVRPGHTGHFWLLELVECWAEGTFRLGATTKLHSRMDEDVLGWATREVRFSRLNQ